MKTFATELFAVLVMTASATICAEDIRPIPTDIKEFVADPIPINDFDGRHFKDFKITQKDLEQILNDYVQVDEEHWLNHYSHVAGGVRTGHVTLKDGRTIKWMVKPGQLAWLEFPSSKRMFLAGSSSEYQRMTERVRSLFKEKKYAESADVCREMIKLKPRVAGTHYDLGCALARLGERDDALAALGNAAELGFEDSFWMEQDADLSSLHADRRFRELLAKVKTVDDAHVEKRYAMPGIKTIAGTPDNGIRFRLRMSPDATKEKPQRLIINMIHPSGSAIDSWAEALAPFFAKHGFALVMFTEKDRAEFCGADAGRLSNTLDALTAIEGISDERPILMGHGDGGQMALALWHSCGAGLGGLILDAAAPTQTNTDGSITPMDIPKDDATRRMPMFVLAGLNDDCSKIWKGMEAGFKQAGTPLTIRYIYGQGHVWMFETTELEALDRWFNKRGKTSGEKTAARGWRPRSIE